MWALTVLSMWAISPLLSMAALALTGMATVFTVWHLVGFDLFGDDEHDPRTWPKEKR